MYYLLHVLNNFNKLINTYKTLTPNTHPSLKRRNGYLE